MRKPPHPINKWTKGAGYLTPGPSRPPGPRPGDAPAPHRPAAARPRSRPGQSTRGRGRAQRRRRSRAVSQAPFPQGRGAKRPGPGAPGGSSRGRNRPHAAGPDSSLPGGRATRPLVVGQIPDLLGPAVDGVEVGVGGGRGCAGRRGSIKPDGTLRTTPAAWSRVRGVKGMDTAQIWLHRSWVSAGEGWGLMTSRSRCSPGIQKA